MKTIKQQKAVSISNLFIESRPKDPKQEDSTERRLKETGNFLDVDKEFTPLAGFNDGNPNDADHHQDNHKHPG